MGLKDVLARREQIQQTREERPFRTLTIKDGDVAIIRFLDDDMYEEMKFHTKVQAYPSGKRFTFNIPCVDDCVYCGSRDEDVAKQKTKIMAWIFVKEIHHTFQDSESKWTVAKKRGTGKPVYIEDVNKVLLFLNSVGNKGAVSEQILEVYQENGTICDRFFSWGRKGSKQMDTIYTLTARDKSDFSTKVRPPMSLKEAADYLLNSAANNLNFNGKERTVKEVLTDDEKEISDDEATQKALDDIINDDAEKGSNGSDDDSLF